MIWLVAILGAMSSWAGDLLCVNAARKGGYLGVLAGGVLFAMAAPFWYYLAKLNHGEFAKSLVTWNVASTILSLIAVCMLDNGQSPREWVGLFIVIAGVIVRG